MTKRSRFTLRARILSLVVILPFLALRALLWIPLLALYILVTLCQASITAFHKLEGYLENLGLYILLKTQLDSYRNNGSHSETPRVDTASAVTSGHLD